MTTSALRTLLVLLCGGLPVSAAETWVDVTTMSLQHVVGPIDRWETDRIVIGGDQRREIPTADLLSLRFPKHPRRSGVGKCVVLVNGDRLAIEAVRVRDEQLTATWPQAPLRPEVELPLEMVSAIVFAPPPGSVEGLKTLAEVGQIRKGSDVVRLIAGDRIPGEFQQLDGGLLEFAAAVGPLKLDRSRVQWLALDPDLAADVAVPPQRWIAFLTDGSRITAKACIPRPDLTVQLTPLVGGSITVPWHEVRRLQQITPRVEFLSDREPLEERYQPYLDGRDSRQQNHSVVGSPLQLRGDEFAVGLGVRSRTAVTYALEADDRWFQSTVGIDDAANGQGSVRFRIELDGEDVWSSGELTGRSEPVETPRIEVRGHRRLAVIVEFGERGDLGDFADWCDPAIVRAP